MATLMSYRQFLLDFLDNFDEPIKDSYLVNLNIFLYGKLLRNSGIVIEQIVFLLVRELSSFRDQFNDLIAFLKTVLNYKYFPLHVFDRFSN